MFGGPDRTVYCWRLLAYETTKKATPIGVQYKPAKNGESIELSSNRPMRSYSIISAIYFLQYTTMQFGISYLYIIYFFPHFSSLFSFTHSQRGHTVLTHLLRDSNGALSNTKTEMFALEIPLASRNGRKIDGRDDPECDDIIFENVFSTTRTFF